MSLIPEKPIVISPTLAATIGLEETILLQLLQECMSHSSVQRHDGFNWVAVEPQRLLQLAPFWHIGDLDRLTKSLVEKGILLVSGEPFNVGSSCSFAFNERSTELRTIVPRAVRTSDAQDLKPSIVAAKTQAPEMRSSAAHAKLIEHDWQPSDDALRQLCQLGATREFALQQVPQFVAYWRDKKVPRHSWESKYLKEVWRQWQQFESNNQRRKTEISLTRDWRPSTDALDILVEKGAINQNFVEDAIPEFILYWRDRGELSNTWDSKFVQHVRRQWQFFTGVMERDTQPKPIGASWQPKESVYDVLRMANIDRPFADQLLPEFLLYWQENGAAQASWSTKYLQYVKGQWARSNQNLATDNRYHGKQLRPDTKSRIRDRSIIEALSDRSWAS